jgi:hypothetical protein
VNRAARAIADYGRVAGETRHANAAADGKQANDPRKLAQALVTLANAESRRCFSTRSGWRRQRQIAGGFRRGFAPFNFCVAALAFALAFLARGGSDSSD